ncbi:MAG TPA: dihydroxyacetone kinase phosphoryl donor subunit DhaM [Ktedonobacterales bacterium]|nr:dihydroxyacetone kinase phosphoryl donor subunit DhaM [Ktedonobacterales bacterium]
MSVGLVIVSHSAKLAEGVAELARQMAQHRVRILPAGGTLDGSLGTSIEKVQAAIGAADTGEGVLLLVDLGSAALVAELAIEQLPPERRQRARLSPAPLVEGAVVAAVEASVGSALEAVAETAAGALRMVKIPDRR